MGSGPTTVALDTVVPDPLSPLPVSLASPSPVDGIGGGEDGGRVGGGRRSPQPSMKGRNPYPTGLSPVFLSPPARPLPGPERQASAPPGCTRRFRTSPGLVRALDPGAQAELGKKGVCLARPVLRAPQWAGGRLLQGSLGAGTRERVAASLQDSSVKRAHSTCLSKFGGGDW